MRKPTINPNPNPNPCSGGGGAQANHQHDGDAVPAGRQPRRGGVGGVGRSEAKAIPGNAHLRTLRCHCHHARQRRTPPLTHSIATFPATHFCLHEVVSLHRCLLLCNVGNVVQADGVLRHGGEQSGWGSITTSTEEVAVYLWNSNATFGCTDDCNVSVAVTLPVTLPQGSVARVYRMDMRHGNPASSSRIGTPPCVRTDGCLWRGAVTWLVLRSDLVHAH